jgi:hypothetical protein
MSTSFAPKGLYELPLGLLGGHVKPLEQPAEQHDP